MLIVKVVKRINSESSHHREKYFSLFLLHEMLNCDNLLIMCVCKANHYAVHLKLTQLCM